MGSALQAKLKGSEAGTIEDDGNTSPRQFVTQVVRDALDKLGKAFRLRLCFAFAKHNLRAKWQNKF